MVGGMLTIDGVRERVAAGQTYEAITTEVLERAESDPAAAHVFTATYPEAALAAARAADAAGRYAPLPLGGMPVTVKDLFDVAGDTTLSGSVARRVVPPAKADAPVVARLRRAGAAITGRTNMVEYAMGGVGLNPHYGTPRNPADPAVDRVPGGSSSGAVVSVGLGLAVAGLGSDTAGSVRIPAALCGLTGFKPTQRRVPLTGATELARTLDSVGAMTNSVRDCLAVDAVIADTPLTVVARPLAGMRLAAPQSLVLDDLDPQVATAYERVLRTLSDAGAIVEEVPLTQFARIAETERALETYDAYLSPTVPIVAPPIADVDDTDEAFFTANRLLLRNPLVANFMNGCAFSIPCHGGGELPVGLTIGGTGGTDAHVAAVALAAERTLADT